MFFPQQIAVPCILCGSIADPVIGELRMRFGEKKSCLIGFFLCMFFFFVTWFQTDLWIVFSVSLVGGFAAVVGETKKFSFLDDDFMIQILPAVFLLGIWVFAKYFGLNLPDPVIYPIVLPW
ncbi:MAG: hypothetical protein QHH15_06170 [Candidatus Thermoplasmatota archaeon]|nr:hypothetical protein [Candidatus Thermoplasmatota archaeon]